jgi:cellulose synthase/poly-beta-1,6-N-acetylglucosamine synthase-like glycosyltransferase
MLQIITSVLFIIFFSLHAVYFFLGIVTKPIRYPSKSEKKRFDFLIVARNEANVIGDLIDSLNQQAYPKELIRVFVLADNCTDDTALVAKNHGAITFENHEANPIGKGLALKRLIALRNSYPGQSSDAVVFFDADNVVDANFTEKINDAYQDDQTLLIGYRASKNFGLNPMSSGSSIIFFREGHFLHHARNRIGLSTHINGTGFMVPNPIIRSEPWQAFSLIEDIEYTIIQLLKDRRVLFVREARFYDEQPIHFKVSFLQRLRWIKGSIQIFFMYAFRLVVSMFKKWHFSKLDLLLWITPIPSIVIILSLINLGIHQVNLLETASSINFLTFIPIYTWLLQFLLSAFAIGAMTVIASWKENDSRWWHKLWAMVTFPFYSLTFIPLFILAPLTMFNLSWYKTPHSVKKHISRDPSIE